MGRPTLKDVADRVGVSAKTVSNVVNGTGWVTAELRERVQLALVEVGYRPNAAARQLRSGRSGMIALAVPELSQPYFAELAAELVREAQVRTITVLVNQTDGLADVERKISEGIGATAVDGIIMSPLALGAKELEGRHDSTPLVLLGEHIGDSAFPHVTVDNTAAAKAATEHLIELGCRRIVAIGAQQHGPNETAVLRLAGYRAALDEAGIEVDESLILPVDGFHREDGARAARTILSEDLRPDAVFAFNDLLALGAMHVLATAGVRVPDDVAVMGFDDIEEGRYATPALSSVSPHTGELVTKAIDLLFAQPAEPGMHTVGFSIAHRASTKGPAQ
ncbi:LacI family DNA-binding transcriptional regulator [Herbiconiux sp. KACC 21604]|uniref:LacI family DNA-binding transcriptional regulator n=1 Tax=unclassified Herbiconiux TaxID=2618217 RepID=UPI001490983A|nr:LacI family DNA-binding transcriptional regulator [Herbiconiux sp. SALV-R1]QJU53220.1 LacI family DNA-binding transcriptional regulator [Herbiconiux sp. SALV-R1]WPO88171.1 LacI family DNA-binding transcriptional regulator [Herbiconiux sp. KACC 21604]